MQERADLIRKEHCRAQGIGVQEGGAIGSCSHLGSTRRTPWRTVTSAVIVDAQAVQALPVQKRSLATDLPSQLPSLHMPDVELRRTRNHVS